MAWGPGGPVVLRRLVTYTGRYDRGTGQTGRTKAATRLDVLGRRPLLGWRRVCGGGRGGGPACWRLAAGADSRLRAGAVPQAGLRPDLPAGDLRAPGYLEERAVPPLRGQGRPDHEPGGPRARPGAGHRHEPSGTDRDLRRPQGLPRR